jgi:fucose permease
LLFQSGVGAILGPILSEPFLSPIHQNNTNFNYNEFITSGNSSGDAFESKLYIPYSISAMTAILSSVIFLVLYILRPYHSPQPIDTNDDRQQLVDENTSSTIRSKFECPNRSTIWMITISGLFLLLYAGTETAYFTFSASYVTRTDLHLTKNTGAYMASVLALSFTITRALSILIAIKMSPQLMIYMDCLILVCGYIIIFIFANTNQTFLWMGNILLGIGFASVFPSYYPFIEGSLRISNMIGSIFLFCSGLSSCICPLIVGLFIETKPLMLIYMNFSLTLLTIIALIVLHITVKVRSKTHNPNETEIEQTEE